jgi:hypothetical protein
MMTLPAPNARHPSPYTESLLATIWQRQWLDGSARGGLIDSLGRQLRVVYPGRRWGGPGPDFQGAVLALADGTLVRGDVEVHLNSADWRAHGHHQDPAYNQTVLHVALWAGNGSLERRHDGSPVPLLTLGGRLAAPLQELAARVVDEPSFHDEACVESAEELARIVDQAGLERFFERASRFEADLEVREPADVLSGAVLVALGYSANKQACAQLAELVPWYLVRCLGRGPDGEARLRALLLGAAGLLPGQRGIKASGGEPRALEAAWRGVREQVGRRVLNGSTWRLIGVRPENTPTRRLVGGAALFARWSAGDFPTDQLELVLGNSDRPGALLELFRARSKAEFWAWHYDFGARTSGARPWQVGRSRAAEIVVNALLPFAYATGRWTGRADLAAAALLAYRRLPAGPWNRVSRAMAAQLFGAAGARHCRTAAGQQGLLHLFKRWCWERRCDQCPAGRRRRVVDGAGR